MRKPTRPFHETSAQQNRKDLAQATWPTEAGATIEQLQPQRPLQSKPAGSPSSAISSETEAVCNRSRPPGWQSYGRRQRLGQRIWAEVVYKTTGEIQISKGLATNQRR